MNLDCIADYSSITDFSYKHDNSNITQKDLDAIYSLYSTPSLKTERIMEIYLILSRITDKNSIEFSLYQLELNILKKMREKQELELFYFKIKKRNIEEHNYFDNLFNNPTTITYDIN